MGANEHNYPTCLRPLLAHSANFITVANEALPVDFDVSKVRSAVIHGKTGSGRSNVRFAEFELVNFNRIERQVWAGVPICSSRTKSSQITALSPILQNRSCRSLNRPKC